MTVLIVPTPALQALTLCIIPVYGLAKYRHSTPLHIVAQLLITFINLQNLASIN